MKSQIFKSIPPLEMMIDLLNQICDKIDNSYYLLTNDAFKKGILFHWIDPFIHSCQLYYHSSKLIYLEKYLKTKNYNHFITIIRQICKIHHIIYTSKIKYIKSNYLIEYKIYC